MGRSPFLIVRCALAVVLAAGAAQLCAQSTASTEGRVSIVEPSSATTEQGMVIGAVTLPLMNNIGTSAGAVSLPLPTALAGSASAVRIGTESIQRDIAQVISRVEQSRASFTIIGDRDQVISIAVPQTVSLLRLSGDGEVEFNTVTSLSTGPLGASRLIATPDGTGALAFNVGGQVQPNPSTTSGDYAGVLIVAVQYN
ncbi:DUF4402 domain-containing protein [Rhizorhabdus dicambivorans]|uniref:DUF4402 domain-containing protein n=1 Tax=Rhizorhabdus dicambivorans TaxID=1850238 RepID=A0A2A4G0L1_9SPHN|nr:DUF4402 domain-containing protein [Rhizorhabdus dicambivorans]ATE64991.1 DUF4402 domain-containing protein [Rhizorhabdus dicambivorans]PCE44265.1 DUF4402 domain-containing protein [Rhizorhabdus dicambivorans]